MIDNLLGSKTNIAVLRFLVRFEGQFFPAKEIAKETGFGLRNIYDSLAVLTHEGIVDREIRVGKYHYKFITDSGVKGIIQQLFMHEKGRLALNKVKMYKNLSELESKLVNAAGSHFVDIFLFGSVAKGRDTDNSDIDLCILVDDPGIKDSLKNVAFNNSGDHEVQLHIFTSEEFLEARKKENPLVMDIMRDGLSLRFGK